MNDETRVEINENEGFVKQDRHTDLEMFFAFVCHDI